MEWTRRSVLRAVLKGFIVLPLSGCASSEPGTTLLAPTIDRADVKIAIRQMNREAAAEARRAGWTVSDADVKTAEAQAIAAAERSLGKQYALVGPVDDAVLTANVVDRLNILFKGRGDVRVDVDKGTVTLYGFTSTLKARSDAEAITWGTDGVRHVVNDISVQNRFR